MKTYKVYFSIGKKNMCFTKINANSKKEAKEIVKSRIKFVRIEENFDPLGEGAKLFNKMFGNGGFK